MPIAGIPLSVNRIAATENGRSDSLTPMVRNGFKVFFSFPVATHQSQLGMTSNTRYIGSDGTASLNQEKFQASDFYDLLASGDSYLRQTLASAGKKLSSPQTALPVDGTVTFPAISNEQRSVRRNNVTIKYAGFPEVGDVYMTFDCYVESTVAKFMSYWTQMAGGVLRVSEDLGVILPGDRSFISRVSPKMYKARAFVQYYGFQDINSNDIVPVRTIEMTGVYPSNMTLSELDNSNDGDQQKLRVAFSVDHIQPDTETSSFTTEVVQRTMYASNDTSLPTSVTT